MATLFISPFIPAFGTSGGVSPGAKLYFYTAGTTTLAAIFADNALTTPLANPVVANTGGAFAAVYLNPTPYRVTLKTADGATIADADPVTNASTLASLGVSTFGQSLLADANATAARATLGLGTSSTTSSGGFEPIGAISTHAAVTSGVHGISSFMATLLDDATSTAALATLGAMALTGSALATNGYIAISGGLVIMWGQCRIATGSGTSQVVTFPRALSAAPFITLFSIYDPSATYNQTHLANGGSTATTATFKAITNDSGTGTVPGFDWLVIGI